MLKLIDIMVNNMNPDFPRFLGKLRVLRLTEGLSKINRMRSKNRIKIDE